VPAPESWYLTITTQTVGATVVVTAAGRVGSAGAAELEAALLAASDGGSGEGCQVILDLAAVDYISSAGLEVIEKGAARLRAQTATLVVRGAEGATKLSLDFAGPLPNVFV
jgi:anti-anti-sigma factor